MVPDRARSRKPEAGPAGEARQLVCPEGRVGRDHDDAAAAGMVAAGRRRIEQAAGGKPVDA